MSKLELIATTTFGLEAIVKREIEALGYEISDSRNGRLTYIGDERAIVKSNLWLRCADRVYVKMAEFKATTFEELFEKTAAVEWESFLPSDAHFSVIGTSAWSKLHSVPACQSIIEKAIVKRLGEFYHLEWLPKNGPVYTVRFMFQKDECVLMIDSSGRGLHDREYRVKSVPAPIKETMAAALVSLSFFKEGRMMVDPFTGSGTIPIEAAMMARNQAPGLARKFDCTYWKNIDEGIWKEEKAAAYAAINQDAQFRIIASDFDPRAIKIAQRNAEEAGVDDCIEFKVEDVNKYKNFKSPDEKGMIICNPPYGQRIGDKEALNEIYQSLRSFIQLNPTWSLFLITPDKEFEKAMGREADRRRKLFNGDIESCYYQYYGIK
ncbi:MAG: class I SAM-dependent RNA methyltransferase [Bacillota bacterium]|nr:class I SAM-dependent RNA methyltransferase [Bacillota bacterium]